MYLFPSTSPSHIPTPHPRLLSQSSRSTVPQIDSHYIAGMNPESDPEHSHGIFSVLTGTRKLVDKWVVSVGKNVSYIFL